MSVCHQKKQGPELGVRFILSSDCSNAQLLLKLKADYDDDDDDDNLLIYFLGVGGRLFPSPATSF